jgi:hypothetical protein
VSLLALVLLDTLAACAHPTVRTPPTPMPVASPSPTATSVPFPAPLTTLLGPAPAQCLAGPPLDTFAIDDTFGGAL